MEQARDRGRVGAGAKCLGHVIDRAGPAASDDRPTHARAGRGDQPAGGRFSPRLLGVSAPPPPLFLRLASMEATTHCEPKLRAASEISSGRLTAAVLIATLSAPARKSW